VSLLPPNKRKAQPKDQKLTIYLRLDTSESKDPSPRVAVTLVPSDRKEERSEGKSSLPVTPSDVSLALASTARLSQNYIARSLQSNSLDPLKDVGTRLFTALFEGERRGIYDRCLARARETDTALRLRLIMSFGKDSLNWVPWEFMYDPSRSDFVALSTLSPVIRQGRPTLVTPPRRALKLPVRILVVGAEVSPELGVSSTFNKLSKLAENYDKTYATLVFEKDLTPRTFLSRIEQHDYDVIHFIGACTHCSDIYTSEAIQGVGLILMPEDGKPRGKQFSASQVVTPTTLLTALGSHPSLHLVTLDACYSQVTAFRLAQELPAVLCYREGLTVLACETLMEGFYRSLLMGRPLEIALTDARQHLDRSMPGSREWGQVVLYLQTEEWQGFSDRGGQSIPNESTASPVAGESPINRRLDLHRRLLRRNLRVLEERRSGIKSEPEFITEQIKEINEQIKEIEEDAQGSENSSEVSR